jgi:hypothetical protein
MKMKEALEKEGVNVTSAKSIKQLAAILCR